MPSRYLAHSLGKLKPQTQNPGDNALKIMLDLGCNAIAAAAADNFSFLSLTNY
jgi:hypothetical protein